MTNNRLSYKRRRDEESQQSRKEPSYKKVSKKSKLQRKEVSGDVDDSEVILVDESSETERNPILVTPPISVTQNKSSGLFNRQVQLALMETLKKIQTEKCPKVIKTDITRIRNKLSSSEYTEPWEYVDDVWLTFDNILLSHSKTSHVYKYCTELSEVFEKEIDSVMQRLGYCCGKREKFLPQKLCCSGKNSCKIPKDGDYYSYQNSTFICDNCFNDTPGDTVTLDIDIDMEPSYQINVKKDQFKKAKNNITTPEKFVDCLDCGRKQHQICVLYLEGNWPDGFVCDSCLTVKGDMRKENTFTAENLPKTQLGTHIEGRVNNFLKKMKVNTGKVHIRMLSNCDATVTVKQQMRDLFVESGELNAEFPYRSKAFFAFQEIDGVDVFIFGMFVQEYSSECPNPNSRQVYITFLDSVNFFEPKQYRSAVYHEILLGYMDYVKHLGYVRVNIWSCPPPLGDHYIFYSHPIEQKIPDAKRLQNWYGEILKKGKSERIIDDYQNVMQQAKADQVTSAAQLPYFNEDYWPYFFEDAITEILDAKYTKKSRYRKCSRKRKTSRRIIDKSIQQKRALKTKLFACMKKHNRQFFTVRLHSKESAAKLAPIRDPDNVVTSSLTYGNESFFKFARDNHHEFSTLRRAKHSTLSILYKLHTQAPPSDYCYVCDNCKNVMRTWYHCRVCDDYDLCVSCKEEIGHEHKMDTFGPDRDDRSLPNSSAQVNLEIRTQFNQSVLQTVKHLCICRESDCPLDFCRKMRCAVVHMKFCTNNSCNICSRLDPLFAHHAKHCQNEKCLYSFCCTVERNAVQAEKQRSSQSFFRMQQYQIATSLISIASNILNAQETTANQRTFLNAVIETAKVQILLQELVQTLAADSTVQHQSARGQTN